MFMEEEEEKKKKKKVVIFIDHTSTDPCLICLKLREM